MIDLVSLDQDITLAINTFYCNASDFCWKLFSNKDIWIPLYLIVAILLFKRFGWKKALTYIVAIVLCIVATDQFANLIKNYVCRLRPCHDPAMLSRGLRLLEGAGGQYGFFSAHASNAFGFAICSFVAFRSDNKPHKVYGWLIFFWATLVSISRVFVGKHYLGDVLVGVIVGLIFGYLLAILANRVADKLKL